MICECGHDQVHHQGLPSDGIERMNLHKQCRKCPCKEFANPNESKDRIKRARDFVDQHIKTLPLPVRLNGITDAEKQEAASLCSNFAAADNHLLSTRVEELNKWRIAFESLTPMGSEWVNDLPKCEDYIRQRMMSGQKAEMKLVHANRRVEELEKENAKYREVLEYYADDKNWNCGTECSAESHRNCPQDTINDCNGYDLARTALTEKHDTAAGEGE